MRVSAVNQALWIVTVLAFCLAVWALVGLGLYAAWSIAQ